jgi:hypothetical protein
MKCPSCGAEARGSEEKCFYCGMRLREPEPAPFQPDLSDLQKSAVKSRKSHTGLVVVLVLGLTAVALLLVMRRSSGRVSSLPGSAVGRKAGPMHVLALARAEASSYCTTGEDAPYPPSNAIDGKLYTVWTEADGKPRINQYITVFLREPARVARVGIGPGYEKTSQRDGDRFPQNDRLRSAELQFSDGTVRNVSFPDERGIRYFEMASPVLAEWMKLTVKDYYLGAKWDDICISEIELWGFEE